MSTESTVDRGDQPFVIVLLGPPGGGKGTQAEKLKQRFGFEHVSTGDLLREEVRQDSSLGECVHDLMERGELVPDEIVSKLLRRRIAGADANHPIILDGYPRNEAQARTLESVTGDSTVYAVNIKVDKEEVIRRIAGRRFCSNCGKIYNVYFFPPEEEGVCDRCGHSLERREDDHEDIVLDRLKVYREQTGPVIEFYRASGNYLEVNGNLRPDEVFDEICEVVGTLVS